MLNGPNHLLNLYDRTFIIFFHHSEQKMTWKMSPLVVCQILGVFVNTLPADDSYFLCNSENLP